MSISKSDRLFMWALNLAKDAGACQEYRLNIPMKQLEKLGYTLGYEDRGEYPEDDRRAQLTSDIDLFYSLGGESFVYQVETIKAMKPAIRGDGKIQYPPVCVYDADDNSDFVHPMNFTFIHLGIREYPSGKLLKPGSKIEFEWENGEREVLLEDKVTKGHGGIFDIERNLHQMKIRHKLIRECHGATVSTPALASYFKDVIGQKNTHVFPNTVVVDGYEFFDVVRKDPNEVRVLWQGSPSHLIDWYEIKDALAEVTKRYPEIKWVIYGQKFPWIHDVIPDDRIEYGFWGPYQQYKLRRGLLNIDINLCPLADDPFNRCKSAIKWYEGSIWPNPEATLAANVEPYKEITDGVNGLLYSSPEEFVEKLGLLVKNVELRKTLAENAKKWVLANRTPEVTIPKLFEFYQELKLEQKAKFAPKIQVARR